VADQVARTGAAVHLTPFVKGDGRAVEAGRRGAAVRAAKRATERATAATVAAELRTLATTFTREELGPIAAAAAVDIIGRVQRGEVSVRDPADWLRALVDVARLEAGEATSASIVAHLGAGATAEVVALRDRARAAIDAPSSSVLAADDPPVPIPDGGDGGEGGSHVG
jgi:hypothetical protein